VSCAWLQLDLPQLARMCHWRVGPTAVPGATAPRPSDARNGKENGAQLVLGLDVSAAGVRSGLRQKNSVLGYGENVANRDIWVWHGATETRSLNDGRIQNPSNPFGIVPLSNLAPRGFGFVHHSKAILDHEVPNLSITIRNFSIAVWGWCGRCWRPRRSTAGAAARALAGRWCWW
jgi:hypothetical protein